MQRGGQRGGPATAAPPDEVSERMSEVYPIRLLDALDGKDPTSEATTASNSFQRDKAFPASSRPARGAASGTQTGGRPSLDPARHPVVVMGDAASPAT